MSDLDDDLLALAGGAESGSETEFTEPISKRSKSDKSLGEAEDDDDDDEVLSKKRRIDKSDLEFDDDNGEEDDEDGDGFDDAGDADDLINPYPLEGKFKDEADRDKLESMDEMQREQILFDRTQEMERFNEKKYLQQRMMQQKKMKKLQSLPKATRSSNRTKGSTNKSSKLDKLNELRKQREQKSKKQDRGYDDEDEDDEDDDEEEEEEESDGYDSDVKWGGVSKSKSKPKSNSPATLKEINLATVGRSLLAKFCFYSNFKDIIIDCYSKINLGVDKRTHKPIYRLVKIMDVVSRPEKEYKLQASKCDLYLLVSQNRKQTKEFPITIFSDSSIVQEEFDRYIYELKKTGETVDFRDEVMYKADQIKNFINKGVSDKDVNDMIARKQKLQETRDGGEISGFDAVFKKARLMDELKIARQQLNSENVRKIIEKLKKLDKVLAGHSKPNEGSESYNTMTKVNERNRKLNSTNIRKAEIKSKNNVVAFDGGDPFSRLKTVTRIFYQDMINQENEKAMNDAKANLLELLLEKSKQEEKIALSSYRVLGEMDRLIKGVEIDFEIEV